MDKTCVSCEHHKLSILKFQFNEIPVTGYCDNDESHAHGTYVFDTDCCEKWKRAEFEFDLYPHCCADMRGDSDD